MEVLDNLRAMVLLVVACGLLLLVDRYGYHIRRRDMLGFRIRRIGYLVPLWQPVILMPGLPGWHCHGAALWLALATALACTAVNFSAIRRLFNPALAEMMGPPPVQFLVADTLTQVGGAVSEEFFFRWYLLGVPFAWLGLWVVPLSAALFVIHHAVHPRAAQLYSGTDYLVQFVMGLGLGAASLIGGSLLAPVVGHLLYNLIVLAGQYYRLPVLLRHFPKPREGCGSSRHT